MFRCPDPDFLILASPPCSRQGLFVLGHTPNSSFMTPYERNTSGLRLRSALGFYLEGSCSCLSHPGACVNFPGLVERPSW